MTPADIGWTICFLFWVACFFVKQRFFNDEDDFIGFDLINLEFMFLGFGWVFIGLSQGWW